MTVRLRRVEMLWSRFPSEISSGHLRLVAPPRPIRPQPLAPTSENMFTYGYTRVVEVSKISTVVCITMLLIS